MTAVGIIFSNLFDNNLPELTKSRALASVPFACRYRLIDFSLSNMVNSGIDNVYVVTHQNYESLMRHIGSGKDWDLARRSGGVKLLPPLMTAFAGQGYASYNTRLESLKNIAHTIDRLTEDYVVLSDCDSICNINLSEMLAQHEKTGADITVACKNTDITPDKAGSAVVVSYGDDGRVKDVYVRPEQVGNVDVSIHILVINRRFLQTVLHDAISHGLNNLYLDVLAKNVDSAKIYAYDYDGYYSNAVSLTDYFACSMSLLGDSEERNSLFNVRHRPVFTKVHNTPPTKYGEGSKVVNSLIADGCIIEGTVENSIIFRGVKVGKGTTVRNSIIFKDTYLGENVSLDCVVTDKKVVIRDGIKLCGHETQPFFIDKGKMI